MFVRAHGATDYNRLFIGQLLDLAELVIEGEIIQIEDSTIKIAVKHQLKGRIQGGTIVVRQFRNWTCAVRWSKYEVGQKAVYCLRRFKSDLFEVIGSGNEGELPILDDSLYFITYISDSVYPELGREECYKFNYDEAILGIEEYLKKGLNFWIIQNKDKLLVAMGLIENQLLQKIAAWKVATD